MIIYTFYSLYVWKYNIMNGELWFAMLYNVVFPKIWIYLQKSWELCVFGDYIYEFLGKWEKNVDFRDEINKNIQM